MMNSTTPNLTDRKTWSIGMKRWMLSFLLIVLSTASALASHYRYGVVTATRLSETSTTVTYRLNVSEAWRLGTAGTSTFFSISGGNTGSVTVPMTVVTDPSGQWSNGAGTANVTLNKSATPTTIRFAGCCKISTIVNNHDLNWDEHIILNTNAPGSSPVSTMPAIINMPVNAPSATYAIPATDPDPGSVLTFGVPDFTGNLAGQSNPVGFSVSSTTGVITFNTVGKTIGQQYNALVTVQDQNGNRIMMDFLINMVGASTPPVFDYTVTPTNGAVYNVMVGQNVSFPIRATDGDANSTVSLSVAGLPSYITTSNFSNSALPATGNPSLTSFSWTPGAGQIGSTNVLNFIATDNVGVQTTSSVTIKVVAEPAPVFIAPTAVQSSVRQIETGQLFQDTVVAQSSLGSNVSIAFGTGIPSNAVQSPSIPTAGANPGQTVLNWTPTPAQFGVHNLSYQATISAFPTIFATRSFQIIVNTTPSFTSTPVTTATVGQPYSYNVTVSDANIPYGDTVDIIGASIPSWLTLVSTGNGTAVLSGTPTAANVGSYEIALEAEDIYHHGTNSHVHQHFDLDVLTPASITAAGSTSFCQGNSVMLSANTGTGLTYQWKKDGAPISGETSSTYAATQSGSYTAVVTSAGVSSTSNTITVSVTPSPISTITSPSSTILCAGSAISLNANTGSGLTYQWKLDNNNITGATNANYIANTAGTYTVAVTSNGCTTTSNQVVISPDQTNPVAACKNVNVVLDASGNGTIVVPATTNTLLFEDWTGDNSGYYSVSNPSYPNNTLNWNLLSGDIDRANFIPGIAGSEIDLSGFGNGVIESKQTFNFTPGSYTFSFQQVANSLGGNGVQVEIGSLLNQTFISSLSITNESATFTVTSNVSAKIKLTQVGPSDPYGSFMGQIRLVKNVASTLAIENGSTDNCSIASITASKTNFTCSDIGPNTVTLTVTDGSGNVGTCQSTVTVIDNISPVISSCPSNINVFATSGSGAVVNYTAPTASDVCLISMNMVSGLASGSIFPIGVTTVTFRATDRGGNVTDCSFTVTVSGQAPVIVSPGDISVNNTPGVCGANVNFAATETTGIPASTITYSVNPGSSFNVGTTTVTATATNSIGTSSTTFNVTVVDNQNPIALAQNVTIQLNASGSASTTAAAINNGSSDNCGIASVSLSKTTFDCSNVGNNNVTLTVTDVNGNSSTANAVVTVQDNIAPTITCAANVSVGSSTTSCNATVTVPAPVATDNCNLSPASIAAPFANNAPALWIDATKFTTSNGGNLSGILTDASGHFGMTTNATYDATGFNGRPAVRYNNNQTSTNTTFNTNQNTYIFTTVQIVAPATNWASVFYHWNRDNGLTIEQNPFSPNAAPSGTAQYHFQTGNDNSNVEQNITYGTTYIMAAKVVGGNVRSFTLYKDNNGTLQTIATTTNSSFTVPVQLGKLFLGKSDVGEYTNMRMGEFLYFQGSLPTSESSIVNYLYSKWFGSNGPVVTNNITNTANASGVYPLGTTTITWTARDASGNTSTCQQTVTVTDNVAPTVVTKNHTVYLDATGNAVITAADVNNGSTDNCSIASLALSQTNFNHTNLGQNTVTLTVTDASGNISTAAATVTVIDNIVPVITCANNLTVNTGSATVIANYPFANNLSDISGNYTPATLFNGASAPVSGSGVCQNGSYFPNGQSVWTPQISTLNVANFEVAVDFNANGYITSNSSSPIIVGGNSWRWIGIVVSPTGKLGVMYNNNNTSFSNVSAPINTWSNVKLAVSNGVSSLYLNGALIHTVTTGTLVTGNNLNFTTTNYANGTALNGCVRNLTIANGSDLCGAKVNFSAPSVVENTPGYVVTQTAGLASGATFPVGVTTQSYSVADLAGNTATCSYTVTVVDATAPKAIAQNVTINLDANGVASTTAAAVNNGSSDACGIASLALSKTSFDCTNVGSNNVTLTVTDVNGNVSTASATVTVVDAIAPTAIAQNVTVTLVNGTASVTAAQVNNGSLDNCGIASLSVSPNSFTCANIGSNPVVLTVTDVNGNVSTANAVVTVIGAIPTVSIGQSMQPGFTQGGAVVLTASSPTAVSYSWTGGPSTPVYYVYGSGTYVVTVTNSYGCTANNNTVVNYNASNMLSSYTIIGREEVELKDHVVVVNGSVGATDSDGEVEVEDFSTVSSAGSFVRAKEIEVKSSSVVTTKIYTKVPTSILPVFLTNPYCNNSNNNRCSHSHHNSCNNHSGCTSSNSSNNCNHSHHNGNCANNTNNGSINKNVAQNTTVVITDSIMGTVVIGKNAIVTFTAPTIYMKGLEIGEGASVRFTQCTKVRVCNQVKFNKNVQFNKVNSTIVTLYVDDKILVSEGAQVEANLYSRGEVDVNGKSSSVTSIKGMVIGEKVDAKKYVNFYWNTNTVCVNNNYKSEFIAEETGLITSYFDANVYPNPAVSSFKVRLMSSVQDVFTVEIYDMSGRLVESKNFSDSSLEAEMGINLSEGVYLVKITQGAQQKTIKVVRTNK